jgi:ATP-dependent helicase HrpB
VDTAACEAEGESASSCESVWPDLSDTALLDTLPQWLGPFLSGITRRSQFKSLDLCAAITALLDWPMQQRLDRDAPTHLEVPSGSCIRLDYTEQGGPTLPVKLQEMFGAKETPAIAGGRFPLLVHLLSPAGRPLQVTRDLVSFWKNGYPAVRAEMRGRYPKHPWPEDPTTAQPTRHVTKRMWQG